MSCSELNGLKDKRINLTIAFFQCEVRSINRNTPNILLQQINLLRYTIQSIQSLFQASKVHYYISIIVKYQIQESKHYRLFVFVRMIGHILFGVMPLLPVQ